MSRWYRARRSFEALSHWEQAMVLLGVFAIAYALFSFAKEVRFR